LQFYNKPSWGTWVDPRSNSPCLMLTPFKQYWDMYVKVRSQPMHL